MTFPNENTKIFRSVITFRNEEYFLRKYQISKFEMNFKLWKKLRSMEEYKYHDAFRIFVDYLQQNMYDECYPETSEEQLLRKLEEHQTIIGAEQNMDEVKH